MNRPKISVLGAGNVGGNCALFLFQEQIGEVILYDIAEGLPQGKALDIMHSAKIDNYNIPVRGTNSLEDIASSDIVIITAGHRRTADMTRDDLLHKNADVITSLVDRVQSLCPKTHIIMISNPLDTMAHLAMEISGFPPNQITGMSGILDAGRFAFYVAEKTRTAIENIEATVLGGHGDSMVPVISSSFVAGRPLDEVLSQEDIDHVIQKTRKAGGEIIKLMGMSSMYAPAAAAIKMVKSILRDEKSILPCSVYLQGEYGLSQVFLSVPVVLGKDGVEEIIELKLSEQEMKDLHNSAAAVKEATKKLNLGPE